jgi:hypothetical protein
MIKDINANVADADNATQMAATAVTNPKEGSNKKVRREIAPVWKVVRMGNVKFDAQLMKYQNTETKRDCLNESIAKYYRDLLGFWLDFRTHAARLVDSKRFRKCCEDRGLNIQSVAEHVVFEGSAVVNRVIRYGVDAILGERIMMFNTPIYKDEAKLYSQSAESKGRGSRKGAA